MNLDNIIWNLSLICIGIFAVIGVFNINKTLRTFFNEFLHKDSSNEEECEEDVITCSTEEMIENNDSYIESVVEDNTDNYEISILYKATNLGVKIVSSRHYTSDQKIYGIKCGDNIVKLTNEADKFNGKSFLSRDNDHSSTERFGIKFILPNGCEYLVWNSKKEDALVEFLSYIHTKILSDQFNKMMKELNPRSL